MKNKLGLWLRLGALGAAAGAIAIAAPHMALGADHLDSPAAMADPPADINDMYAWMAPGTDEASGNLNLVATVAPFATGDSMFSDAVTYVFHVESRAAFGAPDVTETRVLCQFYSETNLECWVLAADDSVVAYVEGDPSDEAGLTNADENVRVYAGLRNDPFFFNLGGFNNAIDTVRTAASSLEFDEAGCPTVDGDTSGLLVRQLSSNTTPDPSDPSMDTPATDDFAASNVLALVVQLDKTLVNSGGDTLSIWASTHRAE